MNISKGKFVFESGIIAKTDEGVMKIKLSDAEVDLKGTCITGTVTDDSTSVALVADSMGNVGTFDLTVDGQTTSITEEAAGINLSGDNQVEAVTLSEEEKNEVIGSMKEIAVQSATKSEESIERLSLIHI